MNMHSGSPQHQTPNCAVKTETVFLARPPLVVIWLAVTIATVSWYALKEAAEQPQALDQLAIDNRIEPQPLVKAPVSTKAQSKSYDVRSAIYLQGTY